MNDDYLWNKTGEPDPEVKELEEILGVLGYQPRELELPVDLEPARRRRFIPWLAIAATVVLALLAAGMWFSLRSSHTPPAESAQKKVGNGNPAREKSAAPTPETVPEQHAENIDDQPEPTPRKRVRTRRANQNYLAAAARRQHEREEALATKEQLLMALRLASEKLNQAQRRTQSPPTPNQMRNQHKVG